MLHLKSFHSLEKALAATLRPNCKRKPESQKEDQKHIEPESQKEDQKHNKPESLQKI